MANRKKVQNSVDATNFDALFPDGRVTKMDERGNLYTSTARKDLNRGNPRNENTFERAFPNAARKVVEWSGHRIVFGIGCVIVAFVAFLLARVYPTGHFPGIPFLTWSRIGIIGFALAILICAVNFGATIKAAYAWGSESFSRAIGASVALAATSVWFISLGWKLGALIVFGILIAFAVTYYAKNKKYIKRKIDKTMRKFRED